MSHKLFGGMQAVAQWTESREEGQCLVEPESNGQKNNSWWQKKLGNEYTSKGPLRENERAEEEFAQSLTPLTPSFFNSACI